MRTYTEEKRIRPDILTAAVYFSIIIMMVYNIFSVRIFGEKGAGFCAGPLSLYFVFYVSFILAVQKAVYIMVRLRARRSQYLNAESNMKKSFRIFVIVGVLLAIILLGSSYVVAKNLFGSPRSYFQVIIAAVSLLFMCPQGVLRGYLQGLGYTKPIFISDILISATSFVSGAIISGILYSYGKKVNGLFHVDEYSAIYGASGMMMGLLIGTIAGFIQINISMALRKAEIAEIIKGSAPKYLDHKNDVLTGLRSILYLYVTPVLACLLDYIFYVLIQLRKEEGQDMIQLLGCYSGRIVSVVIVLAVLCCLPFIKSWNRIMARVERDEYEGARERLGRYIHFSFMLVIPVSVFVFTVSEILQVAIFSKSVDIAGTLTRLGAVMVFFLATSIFYAWMLIHMGKTIVIALNLSISWLVHLGLIVLLVLVLNKGMIGLMLSQLVSMAVFELLCMFMLFKALKYRLKFTWNVAIPLFSSAVAGFVVYLIGLLLVNLVGDILTLICDIIIYIIVYMIIMIALRGVKAHELEKIPLGRFLIGFASRVQHDRFYEE